MTPTLTGTRGLHQDVRARAGARSYVGIDGCESGWVAVRRDEDASWSAAVYGTIGELVDELGDAALLLIDTPIGLPDGHKIKTRCCDTEAQDIVGHSKVFTIPPRPALQAATVQEGLAIVKKLMGKGFFLAWQLRGRIFEVEQLLLERPDLRGRLREVHPEICFWSLNRGDDERPCAPVHSKNKPRGVEERIRILAPYMGDQTVHSLLKRKKDLGGGVKEHDLLDAMSAAVVAWMGCTEDRLAAMPSDPPADPHTGLPMEMVYLGPPSPPEEGRTVCCGEGNRDRRLTLHEAILLVLIRCGRPMTPNEIAQKLECTGLYRKRSGRPASPAQVRRRMTKYYWLFEEIREESPHRFWIRRSDPCERSE